MVHLSCGLQAPMHQIIDHRNKVFSELVGSTNIYPVVYPDNLAEGLSWNEQRRKVFSELNVEDHHGSSTRASNNKSRDSCGSEAERSN